MALTISNIINNTAGVKRVKVCDIAFDSSYAWGGESLTPGNVGLSVIEKAFFDTVSGYRFEYDYTNQKIKAYCAAPPVVFEETVTVTSNVGTLQYPAAYIMYIGVGNAGYRAIPGSLTPVTGSCAVSITDGARTTLTFLAGDSVTSCNVTYVTQAWKEVYDNRVEAVMTAGALVSGHADLTFAAGTPDTVDVGELAIALESVTWDDNGTVKPMKALYLGEDPATTEVAVDFSNGTSSELRLSFREEDTVDASTDTVYINYIRKPSAGFLSDRLVEEDDLTPSSDVVTLSSGFAVGSNALLFGTCGGLPGATTQWNTLIRSAGSVGATATLVKPTTVYNTANTFTFGSDHNDAHHVKVSYIVGTLGEIPGVVPLEVRNGTDISDLSTVKAMFIGR